MDITIRAKYATISADKWNDIHVSLEQIDSRDFDTKEIAECVNIETFFEAHSEADIRAYVERNYDWFDQK